MSVIWTPHGAYTITAYESENDLEDAILEIQTELFGSNRVYLDIKKKIGNRAIKQTSLMAI